MNLLSILNTVTFVMWGSQAKPSHLRVKANKNAQADTCVILL